MRKKTKRVNGTIGLQSHELGVEVLQGARDRVGAEQPDGGRDAALDELGELRLGTATRGAELTA